MKGRQCAKQRPEFFPSTLQRRDGNIETCPTSNKRSCHQCPKTAAQNKKTSMALWLPRAPGNLPWIGVDDPSDMQRLQAGRAVKLQRISNFQVGGSEKLTGADDPRHALQENGGVADPWYMDDGDIMCQTIVVPSHVQEFNVAIAGVGAERNPENTEVIYYVAALDTAPPEWKIDDVKKMAAASTVAAGSVTLGVAVGPRQIIADQLSGKADANAFSCARTRRQNLLSHAKVLMSVASSTFCEHTDTRSCRRNELMKSTTRLHEDLFRGSSQDSRRTAWCRPVRNWIQKNPRRCGSGTPGSTQSSQTAHPGDDARRSHRWPSAATALGSSPRCGH